MFLTKIFSKKSTWNMKPREKFYYQKWERIIDAFKNLFTLYPKDVDQLVGRFPISGHWCCADSVTLNYPYNPAIREQIKNFMIELGWSVVDERLKKGEDSFVLIHDKEKVHLKFNMCHWNAGSTCQKVKIGSKMVEEDIYEIVCNEGYQESAFA